MKNPGASTATNPDFFSTQILQARRFFLNLSPATRSHLRVACGGLEYCDPQYTIQRSSFPFYSIEFVARGLGWLRLGTKEHRLNPGSVFSYGPGVRHEISTDPQQPLIKYFVDFAGAGASALLKSSGLRAGSLAQVFPPTEMQPLFDELIRSGLRGTRRSPRICAILLEALAQKLTELERLGLAAKHLRSRPTSDAEITSAVISSDFGRLNRSRENATSTTPISVACSNVTMKARLTVISCA